LKKLIILLLLITIAAEAQTSASQFADSLYQTGNFSKAIEVYQSLEDKTEEYANMANAYISIGNYDQALEYYKLSIEALPENAILKYEYAKLLSKTKAYDEASIVFKNLIMVDSLNPNYHYELGLVLEQQKDSTAIDQFNKAFSLDGTHQKAIFKVAKKQLQRRKFYDAITMANIGLSFYVTNRELISIKAQSYFWLKEYEKAIIWFEKLLELKENSQFIHEKLSVCYRWKSDINKAIEHQKLALKFEPKNTTNIFILGQLYDELHYFEEAEKCYMEALEIMDAPLDSEYIKLGTILNMQKKHKEALKTFKKALNENPKNPNIELYILLTSEKLFEGIDSKIKLYEDYKTRNPESPHENIINMKLQQLKEEKFLQED